MKKPILHENIAILEVAEPHILDMLLKDKIAAPLLFDRLSEKVAVANPNRLQPLLDRMLKLGHTPKFVR